MLWVSVYKQNMVWYQMLIVFDNWLMFGAIDTNPVFVDRYRLHGGCYDCDLNLECKMIRDLIVLIVE